jgi:hypothetical protein
MVGARGLAAVLSCGHHAYHRQQQQQQQHLSADDAGLSMRLSSRTEAW